ncbi:unnamed protein product [Caenorhabditis bovis]|uniref:Uncharacterized protein n=1 Tax=Caenorhabditis bovis TaxID=2654633 RepID=A0A8S1EFQ7_9PELO|nr:unnamed protein product [Caenorhabditis bovis]
MLLGSEGRPARNDDKLEMELESNITVVKLDHGLKMEAHSTFDDTPTTQEGLDIIIHQTIHIHQLPLNEAPSVARLVRSNPTIGAFIKVNGKLMHLIFGFEYEHLDLDNFFMKF